MSDVPQQQQLLALDGGNWMVQSIQALQDRIPTATTADTLANQPRNLGGTNVGYLFYVSDYGHLVRWDGTKWTFAPGDVGNGFFRDFAIVPQEAGWALANGATVNYLVVGGPALSTNAIVLPNLAGTVAYKKSAAVYTGVIAAASGTTGTGTTGTGTSGDESAHTHGGGTLTTGAPNGTFSFLDGAISTQNVANQVHTHTMASGVTAAGSAHSHSVPGLSVPALAVGSLDMSRLDVLAYFRL